MRKNLIRTYSILSILFVVFTIVVFCIPFAKNAVFWLSYLFVLIAIGVQDYAIHLGFSAKEQVSSKLYGFPVARVGFFYLVIQLIISVIFMILSTIIPIWIVIMINTVALGVACTGLITTDAMREEILRQDKVLKKDVSIMRAMQSKTRMLIGQCDDPSLSKDLSKLAEDMQYSDPVSSDALQEIEFELSQLVDELQKAVVEHEYKSARVLQYKARNLLIERNRLCKLNKTDPLTNS